MNLIVAVDKNWAIGMDNKLLVSISAGHEVLPGNDKGEGRCHGKKDIGKFFRADSLLKNRVNVV